MERQAEYGVTKSDIGLQIQDYLSPNGMALIVPDDITYEQAQTVARNLVATKDLSKWFLGDLFNSIENQDFYSQLLEESKKTEHTINNYKRVSESIRPNGRWENLSWSIHELVAKLDPDDQEEYLKRASEGAWSIERLRQGLRDAGLIQTQKRELKPKVTTCQHCDHWIADTDEGCPWCMFDVAEKRIEDYRAVLTEIANPSGDLDWAAGLADRVLADV